MFSDVQFMTAREKELTFKQWKLFLKSNMALEKFGKRVYHHLSQHCGHIAHYNLHGFWDKWFADPTRRAQFISRLLDDDGSGRLYWGGRSDYRDLTEAMVAELQLHKDRILDLALHAERENLREQRARIDARLKHLDG